MKRPTRHCSIEGCGKILPKQNKTGLCRLHYFKKWTSDYRKKRILNHICTICGKEVEPIVIKTKEVDIIKYTTNCYSCRQKEKVKYERAIQRSKEINK
jgi:hypothetical protein